MSSKYFELAKAVILLPGTVLVFIPSTILYLSGISAGQRSDVVYLLAGVLLLFGLSLALWTVSLFTRVGNGTPAPWSPPKHLVVRGPYHYVRNPMITGVLLILMSEALFFSSIALGLWWIFFLIANLIYLQMVEEPGLIKRFGGEYEIYRQNVPRWIPRLTPWHMPRQRQPDKPH
jgi:protein-S-isoprenylcysteine O-methyltransferase Ste14